MPWIALKKPARKRAGPIVRWREASRERLTPWIAAVVGLVVLLGFWFAVARGLAR